LIDAKAVVVESKVERINGVLLVTEFYGYPYKLCQNQKLPHLAMFPGHSDQSHLQSLIAAWKQSKTRGGNGLRTR